MASRAGYAASASTEVADKMVPVRRSSARIASRRAGAEGPENDCRGGEPGRKRSALLDISNESIPVGPSGELKALRTERRVSPQWKDLDLAQKDNPLFVTEYVSDIVTGLLSAESKYRPTVGYIEDVQKDINPQMRSILVDWLVEVTEEYKLLPETFFLAVNYVDRALSVMPVLRNRLQLLGIACLLVAAKYEENDTNVPHVDEFVYITDNTYTRADLLDMERRLLGVLGFALAVPTARAFLARFVLAAEAGCASPRAGAAAWGHAGGDPGVAPGQLEHLACYLTEVAMLDYALIRFLPSTVAAAAVFLAGHTLGRAPWSATLEHYTSYPVGDLEDCVRLLHAAHATTRGPASLPAIREKYTKPAFSAVATLAHADPASLSPALFGRAEV